MAVRKKLEGDGKLTILVVTGKVAAEELLKAVEDFYREGHTDKLIWDIRDADLTGLSTEQLRQVLAFAKSYGHLRPNGKTAIVVANNLAFGLGRMYEILCSLDDHPVPLRVIKDMDEALEWLDS